MCLWSSIPVGTSTLRSGHVTKSPTVTTAVCVNLFHTLHQRLSTRLLILIGESNTFMWMDSAHASITSLLRHESLLLEKDNHSLGSPPMKSLGTGDQGVA